MMGRSYQNLLVLRPGMMIYPGGGGWTMSTNGTRPEENQFILDGLTNDNPLQGLTNMLYLAAQGYHGPEARAVGREAEEKLQTLSLLVKRLLALPYQTKL